MIAMLLQLMITMLLQFVRLVLHYRTLVCCLLVIWTLGIIIGTLFLSLKDGTSPSQLHVLDFHKVLNKRSSFDIHNPKIIRAQKYCSPLLSEGLPHEGEGVAGSKLEAVLIIMRHGDRGPLQEFFNLSAVNCSVDQTANPDYEKFLLYARQRQHLRTSRDVFRKFDAVPRDGECRVGQLTEFGVLQQLRTGLLLRNAYHSEGLFHDWKQDDLYAVSTYYERTYQSAVAFLYGLVPNFDFVTSIFKPGLGSMLCYSSQFCDCPLVETSRGLLENDKLQHLASHPAVRTLINELNAVLQLGKADATSSSSENRYVSLATADVIFEQLLVYICHQTSLPCWHEKACITIDHLNYVVSYLEWRGKQLADKAKVKRQSRLSVQGLLTDILRQFEAFRTPSRKKHKVILYSAHDVTLMPLLLSLKMYDGNRPPYSSRLVLELYSRPHASDNGTKLYHLKFLYNGKDVTKRVVFCSQQQQHADVFTKRTDEDLLSVYSQTKPKFCMLDSFASFVNKDYLVEMNVGSFKLACQQEIATD